MTAYIKKVAHHCSGEMLGDTDLAGLVGAEDFSTLRHELSRHGLVLFEDGTDASDADRLSEAAVAATQPTKPIELEAVAMRAAIKDAAAVQHAKAIESDPTAA